MSTTTTKQAPAPCPAWCRMPGADHGYNKSWSDEYAGHIHEQLVDIWSPDHPDAEEPVKVRVQAFRHDVSLDRDWADEVYATGTQPAFLGGVCLRAEDARRLGLALIAAADLIEGR